MQPQHVRLAFKCWGGHFNTANIRERTLLCKLMIKLKDDLKDKDLATSEELSLSYIRSAAISRDLASG